MCSLADASRSVDSTPTLLLDPEQIQQKASEFLALLPGVLIRYPVKVNPHPIVLQAIVGSGHGFDVASLGELRAVLAAGASPRDVLFAAPVKAPSHIVAAAEHGVATFVADCIEELRKLAEYAPGCEVIVRLAVSNDGSVFTLTDKFGASTDEAVRLFRSCADLGLRPCGLAFHVGSQAVNLNIWRSAIEECAAVLQASDTASWERCVLDIGGGFPISYGSEVPSLSQISSAIREAVADLIPPGTSLLAEPGRLLVADAGALVCSVIGTAERGADRWAYLDAGAYNALLEVLPGQGLFHFPVEELRQTGSTSEWIVAGPSCDSLDRIPGTYRLAADLSVGDRVVISRTGAYSIAFASPFCGWPPPQVIAVEDRSAPARHGELAKP